MSDGTWDDNNPEPTTDEPDDDNTFGMLAGVSYVVWGLLVMGLLMLVVALLARAL